MMIVYVKRFVSLKRGSTNQKWFLNMEAVPLKCREMSPSVSSVHLSLAGVLTVGLLWRSTTKMVNRLEQLCKDVAITFCVNTILRYTRVMMWLKVLSSELSTDACSIVTLVVLYQDAACADRNSIFMWLIDSDNLRMNSRKYTMDVGMNASQEEIGTKWLCLMMKQKLLWCWLLYNCWTCYTLKTPTFALTLEFFLCIWNWLYFQKLFNIVPLFFLSLAFLYYYWI